MCFRPSITTYVFDFVRPTYLTTWTSKLESVGSLCLPNISPMLLRHMNWSLKRGEVFITEFIKPMGVSGRYDPIFIFMQFLYKVCTIAKYKICKQRFLFYFCLIMYVYTIYLILALSELHCCSRAIIAMCELKKKKSFFGTCRFLGYAEIKTKLKHCYTKFQHLQRGQERTV